MLFWITLFGLVGHSSFTPVEAPNWDERTIDQVADASVEVVLHLVEGTQEALDTTGQFIDVYVNQEQDQPASVDVSMGGNEDPEGSGNNIIVVVGDEQTVSGQVAGTEGVSVDLSLDVSLDSSLNVGGSLMLNEDEEEKDPATETESETDTDSDSDSGTDTDSGSDSGTDTDSD